jgi:hypothetical protein
MIVRALVLLCLVTAALADDRAEVTANLDRVQSASVQPRLLFPRLPITLSKQPVEGLPKLSVAGRYAAVHAGGRDLRFALDAPAGSHALGLLHTRGNKPITGRAEAAGRGTFRVQFAGVVIDGVPLNVNLLYRGASLEATAEPAHHRRGRVVFEDVVRVVLLIDNDGDGKFNGDEDRWIALREDRSRRVTTLRAPATLRLVEPQVPFAEDGTALMLREVAADGSSAKLVRGKPPVGADAVLSRRYVEFRGEYFAAFLREGDAFARRSGLDTRRPRVDRALDWPRESLAAAQERARRSKKPLLVAYYTETNDWWWRYLYTTFRDREVDRLLRRFERVAIDAEKEPEQSFKKSGARALPSLQFFTPDGRPIPFRLRSREKSGKVRELGETRTGITGWQLPTDLEVNLRRVLEALRPR